MNLIIGSHVSFSIANNGLLGSVKEALSYNANTFMFYSSAPQNSRMPKIDEENVKKGHELMLKEGIDSNNVVIHAPYIINSANSANYDFNVSLLKQEIQRCQQTGINKLILHPGSHVGLGIEVGIKNIINTINDALNYDDNITICLETMAGKGTECGRSLEELQAIYIGAIYKDKIGLCLDTCHLNDAGYDITNFDNIIDQIEILFGPDKIKVIHINDSKNSKDSHKDRHANIGYGEIGFDNLINIIYNPRLENVPKILETPYIDGNAPYKEEIAMIRNKKFKEIVWVI